MEDDQKNEKNGRRPKKMEDEIKKNEDDRTNIQNKNGR
jgi:hypothetical protein